MWPQRVVTLRHPLRNLYGRLITSMPAADAQLLRSAGLEQYFEAVSAEWEALRACATTVDVSQHLKVACGVTTLGHRHRLVSLLAPALAEPRASTCDVVQHATLAPPHPTGALCAGALPPHIAAMVVPCQPFAGPLPFMMGDSAAAKALSDPSPRGHHLQIDCDYPGLWRVHDAPPVYICEDFLTSSECDALTRLADPLLRQSLTHGGASHKRTSKTCHLRKGSQPCPEVLRKVSLLTRKPIGHMEHPQVARYEEGQFYEMHFDGDAKGHGSPFTEPGGQRLATCLVYLNDVARGGETRFNRLGFDVLPRKGCAVLFFPGFADHGGLDARALHEARPAVDRKYVCQVWIRESELPQEGAEGGGMGHRLLEALYADGR